MHYYLACCYARAGEPEAALDCLEEAAGAGWSHGDWLDRDPDLDSLRASERFQKLAAGLRRPPTGAG